MFVKNMFKKTFKLRNLYQNFTLPKNVASKMRLPSIKNLLNIQYTVKGGDSNFITLSGMVGSQFQSPSESINI